jgi:hypothetical protein
MEVLHYRGFITHAKKWPGRAEDHLDRALVAGLMLESLLEPLPLAADPQTCRLLLRARLKRSLVSHLAGQVSLDRFRLLMANLDHWFTRYYPLLCSPASPPAPESATAAAAPVAAPALREDLLRVWLGEQLQGILPQRPHRKLSLEKLFDFLRSSRGGWFKIKDFQQYFGIDRKTAWEYLQKLRTAGLLRHNRERSAAVRYCLEDRFLLVRADALRQEVSGALAGQAPDLAGPVADWLIATGGEAFWEQQWHRRLGDARAPQISRELLARGLLEQVRQSGARRLLRLQPRWLKATESAQLPV